MEKLRNRRRLPTTTVMFGAIAGVFATPSIWAQTHPASQQVEEVVVTGSSIRGGGASPVGSNLLKVDRAAIEATGAQSLQQILSTVPSLTGFGNAAQGGFGSADNSGTYAPTVHGLGASASNGTLILIDGHRVPLTGINHTLADPNIIAPLAIERVEVLAEGASAVYGSDAVAGVLNFITRKNYNGAEASAQTGYAKNYKTDSFNVLWGHSWDNGSLLLSYGFSHRSNLRNSNRSFTAADQRGQGGNNFANFNCSPASVQPAGTTNIFAFPYTGTSVPNAGINSFCDYTGVADLLPRDDRHDLLVKVSEDVTDKLRLTADTVYSKKTGKAAISRGAVTATVWGPGSTPPGGAGQINPFFVGPAGVTSETVRFDADDLLGGGAFNKTGQETFFVTGSADYQLPGDWAATLGGTWGKDTSFLRRTGFLCGSCATLALNGTTNGGGNTTLASIPGTTIAVLGLPLTTANALDVWSIGGNRTSAAIFGQLTDSEQVQTTQQNIKNLTLKFDGPVLALPGGELRAAVGGEYVKYDVGQVLTTAGNIGPASKASSTLFLDYGRSVKSAYVEALVPIVGLGMGVPGIRRLDISLAGRYDHYSDFGSTKNPKIGGTWEVIKGLELKGNYSKSFTAPALTSRGNANGITSESGFTQFANGAFTLPSTFPGFAPFAASLPAGSCTATGCTLGTTVGGILIGGGNKDLQPQKGKSYSLGLSFVPSAITGLRTSATFWTAKYNGAITAPAAAFAVSAADLNNLLTLYPGGATPAQIAAATGALPQTSTIASPVYFIYNFQQRNALSLNVNGVDADASYTLPTLVGKVTIGLSLSEKLKFDQRVGTNGSWFSVLNTAGFNTTFPSNKLSSRVTLGLDRGPWNGDLFFNHTGSYKNWNGNSPFPLDRSADGLPIGGGQHIGSQTTVDLHLAYNFGKEPGIGLLSQTTISLDGTNIFDRKPPFFNVALGYDAFNANPIGRILTAGLSKKF